MDITIFNKKRAEKLSYTDYSDDKVIISISTPGDEKSVFNPENSTIKDVLYLSFYDISYETQDIYKGYPAMTDEDAVKIRDFVLKWKDKVNTLWYIVMRVFHEVQALKQAYLMELARTVHQYLIVKCISPICFVIVKHLMLSKINNNHNHQLNWWFAQAL